MNGAIKNLLGSTKWLMIMLAMVIVLIAALFNKIDGNKMITSIEWLVAIGVGARTIVESISTIKSNGIKNP